MARGREGAGPVRHVMDLKRPHLLVAMVGAVLCAAVGALLLVNPGQRGDMLEGVRMSVVRALDRGVPVDLPEDLARDLVPLIRRYDKGDYNDLSSYQPAVGDVYLSDREGGTVYYVTRSLDSAPVLVRINHDGYGWSSAYEALTLTGLEEDPEYLVWAAREEDYLATGRADDLYALRTAYVGNQVADMDILTALNVAAVAGPFTIELQTGHSPYGITLHLESYPALDEDRRALSRYLAQTGTLFVALVDNAGYFNWDCPAQGETGGGVQPGLNKPMDQEAFRSLYADYRAALGDRNAPAPGEAARYSFDEPRYLSADMPWQGLMGYTGNVTVAREVFSVQFTHALSSAHPMEDNYPNPVYHRGLTPDRIVLKDGGVPGAPEGAEDGVLSLEGYQDRALLAVFDSRNQITPYCLYQLDDELWLCHRSFTEQEAGGGWKADWLFSLVPQDGGAVGAADDGE